MWEDRSQFLRDARFLKMNRRMEMLITRTVVYPRFPPAVPWMLQEDLSCIRLVSTSWRQVIETQVGLWTFTRWNVIVLHSYVYFCQHSEAFILSIPAARCSRTYSCPPGTICIALQSSDFADKFSLLCVKSKNFSNSLLMPNPACLLYISPRKVSFFTK